MKSKILKLLQNSEEAVSGQMLCEKLGVSRTAVWKVINQLKDEGYEIEAAQNKGYTIKKFPDVLTAAQIESQLMDDDFQITKDSIVKSVHYYDEIDSTNNEAKRVAENEDTKDGTLFITESQTTGRGRRGRNWASPKGSGIWMTLLLKPQIPPASASMLTIVSAIAMVEAINKALDEASENAQDAVLDKSSVCGIKWPNDIVLNGKKICGILTEMSAEMDYIHFVVIGIGLNANTLEFDESIRDVASSILKETGIKINRSRLVALFSRCFNGVFETFVKSGDLAGLKERYNNMLLNRDREVKAIYSDRTVEGVARGINDVGELIVDTDEGEIIIRAGEVSVRGLYGYV